MMTMDQTSQSVSTIIPVRVDLPTSIIPRWVFLIHLPKPHPDARSKREAVCPRVDGCSML